MFIFAPSEIHPLYEKKSNLQPRFLRFFIIFELINDKNRSTLSVERFF